MKRRYQHVKCSEIQETSSSQLSEYKRYKHIVRERYSTTAKLFCSCRFKILMHLRGWANGHLSITNQQGARLPSPSFRGTGIVSWISGSTQCTGILARYLHVYAYASWCVYCEAAGYSGPATPKIRRFLQRPPPPHDDVPRPRPFYRGLTLPPT